MQCLNPIYVPNQSRFVNLATRHAFLVPARCGKCASCQQNKAAEWEFRAFVHAEDCFKRGGFVLFDTLTYSEDNVPYLSDYEEFAELTSDEDYYCFRSDDLRHFFVRLRRRLSDLGYERDAFNYFVSTEYGSHNTQRPHYHVLFYVYVPIDSLEFSRLVNECWQLGRTDGLPWRSVAYVRSNVFRSSVVGSRRVVNYVTKYVQKSSSFESEINKRIVIVLHRIAPDMDWLFCDEAKQIRRKLYRLATQFHRQSVGFGLSVLSDESIEELFERGFFRMPNGKPSMFSRVPISQYYVRKVCYYKHTFDDGYQCWFVRPFANRLLEIRAKNIQRNLSNYYRGVAATYRMQIDADSLADYVLNYKGRMVNDAMPGKTFLLTKLPSWYMYASIADKNHFNMRFISELYRGCKDNYISVSCRVFKLSDCFDNLLFNQNVLPCHRGFDDILSRIAMNLEPVNHNKQALYNHLQHVKDVAKCLYV